MSLGSILAAAALVAGGSYVLTDGKLREIDGSAVSDTAAVPESPPVPAAARHTGRGQAGRSDGGVELAAVGPGVGVVPLPATSLSVALNGVTYTPAPLDLLTTRSGRWRLFRIASDRDMAAYLMTLDENAGFARVFVCRKPVRYEDGRPAEAALSLRTMAARVNVGGTTRVLWLAAPSGACKMAQTGEPVPPRADWIRAAVAEGRLPAYRRERSWITQISYQSKFRKPDRPRYDPTSLGGEGSGSNYVGVTGSMGGEYPSSRGFVHDIDAEVVDAALHREDGAIRDAWSYVTGFTWYSLGFPQGVNWSSTNSVLVDPQRPLSGDRPYEVKLAGSPHPEVDSLLVPPSWTRDLPHLENTAFVHWIATEDPLAGLVVQGQLAFALANFYEYQRPAADRSYHGYSGEERGIYNSLSALWKSRDVARRVQSQNGRLLWSRARVETMVGEVIANYNTAFYAPVRAAERGASSLYQQKLTGALFGQPSAALYELSNGTRPTLMSVSGFQPVQYGKEPLYLFTLDGNPVVRDWFAMAARRMVVRLLYIGGSRGVDSCTDVRGSSQPIGPTSNASGPDAAATPPFTSDVGWARWLTSLCPQAPSDRYDGSWIHTMTQSEGMLLLAQHAVARGRLAPVPDLDKAMARVGADKNRTNIGGMKGLDLNMYKHLGSPVG